MATSNSTHQRNSSVVKPRVQPILPALPLIQKLKKVIQPVRDDVNHVAERSKPLNHSDQESTVTIDIHSSISAPRNDPSQANEHHSSSAFSISVPDESVSVQSSQDPNSTIDNESSVSSAVTSEIVNRLPLTSHFSQLESVDVVKSDQDSSAHTERTELIANGSAGFGGKAGDIYIEQNDREGAGPDITISESEISPVKEVSGDRHMAELSAYSNSVPSATWEVAQKLRTPLGPQYLPTQQHDSPSEGMRNGHTPSASLPRLHNNRLDSTIATKPLPTVLEHLLFLANSKQLADWTIQVEQPAPNVQPFLTYVHSFILLRSERTKKAMAHPSDPIFNLPVIRLTPVRAIQPHAFEAAIRFLYSDTVLSPEALFPRDTYLDRHARAHIVDYVLSYWVAGIELGLTPVASRAYSLLAGMMDWDIAELLVREVYTLRIVPLLVSNHQIPGEVGLMSESILRLVFGLFIHRFDPEHFRLDVNHQHSATYSRLAQFDQTKSSANPVLAGMVFGSMPSTADVSPISSSDETSWSADTIASSILLNIDFTDLNTLGTEFVRTYGTYAAQVLSEVIHERERRRLQIWNNRSIPNRERVANSTVWDIIGWREEFELGKLTRERVGYVLPHDQPEYQA